MEGTRTQSISGIINSVCWNSAVTWARGYSPRFTHLRDDKLEGGCKNVPTPLCSFRFVTAVPCLPNMSHGRRASQSVDFFFFFLFAERLPQNVEMLRDGDDDVRQAVKQDAFGSRWFWETEQNRNLQGRNEQRRQTGKTHTHTRTHTLKKKIAVRLNWGWLYSRRRLVFVPKLCLNIEADRSEKSRLSRGFNPICIFITIN